MSKDFDYEEFVIECYNDKKDQEIHNASEVLSALPAEPKASKRAAQISLIALVASFKNLRGSKLAASVPQDWLEIINNHGGDMGQTYGVPVNEIVVPIYFSSLQKLHLFP
jgi:hypothetical protein